MATRGGLAYNTFPGRRAKIEAEQAQEGRNAFLEQLDVGLGETSRTMTPDAASAFQKQLTTYKRMFASGDPMLQKAGLDGIQEMAGFVRDELEQRDEQERTFVMDTFKDQRDRATKAGFQRSQIWGNFDAVRKMLDDPTIDPNQPIHRAQLIEFFKSGPRSMLADPEGFEDAMGKLGAGIPIINGIMQVIAGVEGAEEFEFTKEQWRQAAYVAYEQQSSPYTDEINNILNAAGQLGELSQQREWLPKGYSSTAYVGENVNQDFNPISPVRFAYPEVQGGVTTVDQIVNRDWKDPRTWLTPPSMDKDK